ncbi:MAG: zinc dependent phospholipase C family protein [Faecousia sp.]
MPANYAHYRFGKLALPALPAGARQCIGRFRRMYDIGLHGPDILFYYNPVMDTPVGQLGHSYHTHSGQLFFPQACRQADSEAARAYLYGLLGHYCLDSVCHPYVNRLVDIGEARHIALESELERRLLLMDGNSAPQTFDMSKRLRLTRGECMTVAQFYPPATGANIHRSMKLMSACTHFLASPKRAQREKLLSRFKPELCDIFIPETENEDLTLYVDELVHLYAQALERYPRMVEQLMAHMETGADLGEDFAPSFG